MNIPNEYNDIIYNGYQNKFDNDEFYNIKTIISDLILKSSNNTLEYYPLEIK